MSQQRDTDKAIRNLMNWSDRPAWANEKSAVFAAHLAPACERLGRSQEELVQELAEHGYGGMLFGMMFEDLASRGLPPDGRNLIDDYLQRRGWRESVAGRRYLQQLRDSVLSLYEVIAVSPGRHCDLRVANYHHQCSRTRTTLPSSRALTVGSLIARPVVPRPAFLPLRSRSERGVNGYCREGRIPLEVARTLRRRNQQCKIGRFLSGR